MAKKTYSEDLSLEFKSYDQLSYNDTGGKYVELFQDDQLIGKVEVWTDRDNETREGKEQEYILINHEMIYLDSLSKR